MFGTTPNTTTATTGLGGFGGFSFGNAQAGSTLAATTPATGFSLAGALDSNQGAQKAVRFDTGLGATQVSTVAPSAPLTLGGYLATSTAAPGGGFSFATPAATTAGKRYRPVGQICNVLSLYLKKKQQSHHRNTLDQ